MNSEILNLSTYHGIDARYTGPHAVVPTLSCRNGTGFSEPHEHDTKSHDTKSHDTQPHGIESHDAGSHD